MNRWERYCYEKNLARAKAEEQHVLDLAKARALLLQMNRDNEEEAMRNGWHIQYDYARAFDGPLRPNGGW